MGQGIPANSIAAGTSLLRLLLQLQHQLFPFGAERGMLLAKAFEHFGQPLGFLRALIHPQRRFRIGNGGLQSWNLLLPQSCSVPAFGAA